MRAFEAILGLISLLFLTQNGLNSPKLCTVALTIIIQYLGDPLGAILGVISVNRGHLEPIWRPNRKILVIMGQCHPFLQPKRAFISPFIRSNGTDYKHTVIVGALNLHQALFVDKKG